MTHEYGRFPTQMKQYGKELLTGEDSGPGDSWKPSLPQDNATLWRYMSFAKFYSLLERKALFFSLVGPMEDKYEGFIWPPATRGHGDPLQQAEYLGHTFLRAIARASLISCWTESNYESSLMWKAYAGSEGVAVRTTFHSLKASICSVAELPIEFGRVKYVDYKQGEVPRWGSAPLFHKRTEYREEGEVRAVLPPPPYQEWIEKRGLEKRDLETLVIPPDPDVDKQRGRYVPVNLEVLVKEVILPPHATSWFAKVVRSAIHSSLVTTPVTRSSIEMTTEYRDIQLT